MIELTDRAAVDQRLIKALAHPLREKLLQELNLRVASPSQLAKSLDAALGNVAYHVQVLRECDAIELVETKQVRGALEHFYRATTRAELDDEHWAELPLSVRRALDAHKLTRIWDDVTAAAATRGFDGERTHVSETKLDLDNEAYSALAEDLARLVDRALALQAETVDRRVANGEGDAQPEHRTELVMLHFERPPAAPRS